MKMPDFAQESFFKSSCLNTATLTGLSVLWGTMLGLISPWWNVISVFLLMSGYGHEISRRKQTMEFRSNV